VPQQIIVAGGCGSFTQWITLFEHRDDDEFDGQMGLDDEEDPRILINFVTAKETTKTATNTTS